jgi:hypothetical protein
MKPYSLDRNAGEAIWMFDALDTIKADAEQASRRPVAGRRPEARAAAHRGIALATSASGHIGGDGRNGSQDGCQADVGLAVAAD